MFRSFPVRLEEGVVIESAEHHGGTTPLRKGKRMHKDYATQQNAEELSSRHDGCEQQCAKLPNRVQDTQLPQHGGGRQNYYVSHRRRMPLDEIDRVTDRIVAHEPK